MKNQVKKAGFKTLDQVKDNFLGKEGTAKRDQYEVELKSELIGIEIKKLRIEQKLSQAELGERIGVKKGQISKIENNSSNVTVNTLSRVFSALGKTLNLEVRSA
ncbi:helix-turn-helix domain-containing protein [Labilibaculum sp. DW002]|uniref:Helix-turn-helix domain-containing protein n=1 Tax=Paralabilibaculum antarcticum TaxID=2912572 RepID=A0ABT5VQS5_9BACT|nr:helix-turn-helix transcriptional regulator [Labilibaculum sp. DW002]MDE5417646.1 helix-turn-helix domain-containing protein [Labilibaculum sp. DW002]